MFVLIAIGECQQFLDFFDDGFLQLVHVSKILLINKTVFDVQSDSTTQPDYSRLTTSL